MSKRQRNPLPENPLEASYFGAPQLVEVKPSDALSSIEHAEIKPAEPLSVTQPAASALAQDGAVTPVSFEPQVVAKAIESETAVALAPDQVQQAPGTTKAEPRERKTSRAEPSRAKAREPQNAGVSASRAYRIGTMRDPYRRADGAATRPIRVTLPVPLIEKFQILAIRRGRTPTALVQELLEDFVSTNSNEI
jgi:hypothetical protein